MLEFIIEEGNRRNLRWKVEGGEVREKRVIEERVVARKLNARTCESLGGYERGKERKRELDIGERPRARWCRLFTAKLYVETGRR